jgi:hypothetical protein
MKNTVEAPDWSTIPVPIDDGAGGTLSDLGRHQYRFPVPMADVLICLRWAVGLSFTHTLEPGGRASKTRTAGT